MNNVDFAQRETIRISEAIVEVEVRLMALFRQTMEPLGLHVCEQPGIQRQHHPVSA